MYRILMVEDDKNIQTLVVNYFTKKQADTFVMEVASDGQTGVEMAYENHYDYEHVPLFVRANSIIPIGERDDTTDYDLNASDNQNIQSVFVGHASVCAGYARAYQYLLQRAGMFCSFVEGSIPSTGDEHAWNIVRMGDEYTYVDVTWGDPTYPGQESEGHDISYDYFGLTTSEIERDDHTFADASMWPNCSSPAFSYYANAGLLFDSYDASALSNAFWQQAQGGSSTLAFKFSNEEAYAQARDALEAGELLADDMRSLFQSTNRSDYSFQYQVSDSLYILKLFL